MNETAERSGEHFGSPVEGFQAERRDWEERMAAAEAMLLDGLPKVEDPVVCNRLLSEAGRPDLAIAELAPMLPIAHPSELPQTSNFRARFEFTTATISAENPLDTTHVPITKEELWGLLDGSFRFSDKFPYNHWGKQAFRRMFVLFPDFTESLVLNMSAQEEHISKRYQRYWPELFVAYQLMSRLVDIDDARVVSADGKVDNWYLGS